MSLAAKFIEGAHHAHDDAFLRRGRLQLFPAPLQNGILNRFGAVPTSQEVERARAQPGVEIQRHHVTPISRFTEERQL